MNENVAIRSLICDSLSISLTDLADEVLQLSENKNHKQVKLRKNLHRMYVTLERSFGIIKGLWRCLLERTDSKIENVSNVIINYCCVM